MRLKDMKFACGSSLEDLSVSSFIYLVEGHSIRLIEPGVWKIGVVGTATPNPKWAVLVDGTSKYAATYKSIGEVYLDRKRAYEVAEAAAASLETASKAGAKY